MSSWLKKLQKMGQRVFGSPTRKNRSTARKNRADQRFNDLYSAWHWGEQATWKKEVNDDRLPERLIEIGRFFQIEMTDPDTGIEYIIRNDRLKTNHLTFDPSLKLRPLYWVLDEKTRAEFKKRFWTPNDAAPILLSKLAQKVGGRQAKRPYPRVVVKPIGIIRAVMYATVKKGDGPSLYDHDHGENSGKFPWLAVSEDGMIWYAGGNYTCPEPGITD